MLHWGSVTLMQPCQISTEFLPQLLTTDSIPEVKAKLMWDECAWRIEPLSTLQRKEYLKQLCDVFTSSSTNRRSTKKEFYEYLQSNCNMAKITFLNHQSYLTFLNNHERFQLVPVTFTELLSMISSIGAWFETEECGRLSLNNYSSQAFWEDTIQKIQRKQQNAHPLLVLLLLRLIAMMKLP